MLHDFPPSLKRLRRWVLWRRERGTKLPYAASGRLASTTDPADWSTFDEVVAVAAANPEKYAGLGYVFVKGDGLVGVDLDDCRDPVSGTVEPWAQEIIDDLASYAEVSPSETGVKVWCKGRLPGDGSGKRAAYEDGAVELYQSGRYFAATGRRIGDATEAADAQPAIDRTWRRAIGDGVTAEPMRDLVDDPETFATAAEIADLVRTLAELPDAVSGDRGSDATLRAACEIRRAGVYGEDGYKLLENWNATKCLPPWSDRQLRHKWDSARRHVPPPAGVFGVLDTTPPAEVFDGRYRFRPVEFNEFLASDYHQSYLVPDLVVEGEPLIIGAAKKSLKTLCTLDLVISLASGTPVFGEFEVPKAVPAAFLSGESGKATLQRRAREIVRARDIRVPRGQLFLDFDLPQISNADHVEALTIGLRQHGIRFLAIDPAYLCLLDGGRADDAKNVYAMGGVLRRLTKLGAVAGITVALVHHVRKRSKGAGAVTDLDLDDLSGAGVAEWARQWWLLARVAPYVEGSGRHVLRLKTGGSAGHGGRWRLTIDEGNATVGDMWSAIVETEAAADANQVADVRTRLFEFIAANPGATLNAIAAGVRLSKDRAKSLIKEAGDLIQISPGANNSLCHSVAFLD